jgi:phosphatidylserine/phosphatidylglycerophosphate/cardiolipin synthase-like enzyme
MGSVLHLHRGLQRKESSLTAATERPESLLRPGHNVCAVARAERLSVLVDAEAYFRAFHRAALRAKRSITILGWDFNSQTRLHFDPVPQGGPPALLGEFLNYLVRRRRGPAHQRAQLGLPDGVRRGPGISAAVRLRLEAFPARAPQVRRHPSGGRLAAPEDRAHRRRPRLRGGIDLTVRRWDSSEHAPDDPRRVAYGKPYPPFHDLMVALDGEAALALARIARERWRLATGRTLKAVSAQNDPWPPALEPDLRGVEVGIARTMPPREDAPAVREVEALYLDQIASARREIYIENQYFTSPGIAAALEKRLGEADGPEIVLVLRLLSHGWLEEATMHVLRTRLIQRLKKADRHGRFHVYYPHIPGLGESCCLDVHSKMMAVDDRQLRVGSANLCKRSMGMDTECDVLIESRGDAQVAAAIRGLRDRLLAEHLGVAAARFREVHDKTGSLHGAIASLRGDGRTLRELDETKEWPDALLSIASVADPSEPIALDFLSSDRVSAANQQNGHPAWGRLALFALLIAALAACGAGPRSPRSRAPSASSTGPRRSAPRGGRRSWWCCPTRRPASSCFHGP